MVRTSRSCWSWYGLPDPENAEIQVDIEVPWGLLWNKIIPEHVCRQEERWDALLGTALAGSLRLTRQSFRANPNSPGVEHALDTMCATIEEQARKGLALPCVLLYRRSEEAPWKLKSIRFRKWDVLTPSGIRVIILPPELITAYMPSTDVTHGPTPPEEWCESVAHHLLRTFGEGRLRPHDVVPVKGGKSRAWHDRIEFVTIAMWEKVAKDGAAVFASKATPQEQDTGQGTQ